ncbi:MAG: copper resistance system multicopper oxidase [Sphingomonadales bacterium]
MAKYNLKKKFPLRRRQFLQGAGAVGLMAALEGLSPNYITQLASPAKGAEAGAKGLFFDLNINKTSLDIGGKDAQAITVNGTIPGPLIRLREGQTTTMAVTNNLDEDTSIHWHGLLLPPDMDGVPGVSFAGIKSGETFTYNFPVKQSGTYWYHSHSGLQEQVGHFGPIIIDPIEPDPFSYDREFVLMLSDWTFEDPYRVLKKLKKQSDYYNFQKRTVGDFFKDASNKGLGAAFAERKMWAGMRMSPTDIADITGYTYTYLMNGQAPASNWTGLFRPGEKIRLRIINSSAMSFFDFRIPGLKMTVVQADGQNVQPVTVDEFRIGTAETYDVIVEPEEDRAYTIFAESMDRSGYAAGTLAPREGMTAPLPERRTRPILSMADMGMADMDMKGMDSMGSMGQNGMEGMKMDMKSEPPPIKKHGPDKHGPGNAMVVAMPRNRLGDPGVGLQNTGTRVLVYNDLRSVAPGYDKRAPEREIELHLTGNMERYMWSFDGKKFSEAKGPIEFRNGERLRLTMINDTMMSHPIHLHGMWMELDNGAGEFRPRKHTINVKPAEQLSVIISVDAPGNWAFHCHLLYHMEMGMFRIVSVKDSIGGAS